MNIKSFGCSFIFGTDLPDDGRDTHYATPSNLTWPALWAKKLGYGYQCYARPGSGNLQIMERVLSQATNIEKSLFVIGWSWIDRFDYINENQLKSNWPGTPWSTCRPNEDSDINKVYYRDLHSQYRDKLATLTYMRVVIDTLKQKELPFVMTFMDNTTFETQWHTSPAVSDLQDYVSPYMTTFNGNNFLDWSQKNGYAISSTAHPLEEAHCAAVEHIQSEYIRGTMQK